MKTKVCMCFDFLQKLFICHNQHYMIYLHPVEILANKKGNVGFIIVWTERTCARSKFWNKFLLGRFWKKNEYKLVLHISLWGLVSETKYQEFLQKLLAQITSTENISNEKITAYLSLLSWLCGYKTLHGLSAPYVCTNLWSRSLDRRAACGVGKFFRTIFTVCLKAYRSIYIWPEFIPWS